MRLWLGRAVRSLAATDVIDQGPEVVHLHRTGPNRGNGASYDDRQPEPCGPDAWRRPDERVHSGHDLAAIKGRDDPIVGCLGQGRFGDGRCHQASIAAECYHCFFIGAAFGGQPEPVDQGFQQRHDRHGDRADKDMAVVALAKVSPLVSENDLAFPGLERGQQTSRHHDTPRPARGGIGHGFSGVDDREASPLGALDRGPALAQDRPDADGHHGDGCDRQQPLDCTDLVMQGDDAAPFDDFGLAGWAEQEPGRSGQDHSDDRSGGDCGHDRQRRGRDLDRGFPSGKAEEDGDDEKGEARQNELHGYASSRSNSRRNTTASLSAREATKELNTASRSPLLSSVVCI